MQNQELTYKKIYDKLAKRTDKYAGAVKKVFMEHLCNIATMCEGIDIDPDKVFHFNDYPEIATKVQEELRTMYSELYQQVRGDISREWNYANNETDRMVRNLFGAEAVDNPHFAKYFQRNKEAMDTFFARKQDGLNLSQRIWRYVGEAKEELELTLDLGLGEGKDADALSRDVRKYLQDPDKLFRRVRNKHGELVLSKAAKAYHPGRGKYRSSYKNAMRLTRTETNMAYRAADITRWQQMPFVLGYEVKMSHSHAIRMPHGDICDTLAGKYPSGFVFKGWHPHCLCYMVPLLCTDKELEELTSRILEGTEDEFMAAGIIPDVPQQFKDWVIDNNERISTAAHLPYFLKDNYPGGDVSKPGNWLQMVRKPKPAGAPTIEQLATKSGMEAMAMEDWKGCSNFVPLDDAGQQYMLGGGNGVHQLCLVEDNAIYKDIMDKAAKGKDAMAVFLTDEQAAQLAQVAGAAKYASKQPGTFVTSMQRNYLESLIYGDSAKYGKSLHVGTSFSRSAKAALGAEKEQALVVIHTPKGSRYLQTIAGEQQEAVMLPNTKYKVVGKKELKVKYGGENKKLMQYELELVDDGSSFAKDAVKKRAAVTQELKQHNDAVKDAGEVIKTAKSACNGKLGIDTAELDDMLGSGKATAAEIKAKTQELADTIAKKQKEYDAAVKLANDTITDAEQWADMHVTDMMLKAAVNNGTLADIKQQTAALVKDIDTAQKSLVNTYGTYIDNPVEVYKAHGLQKLDDLFKAVENKVQQWLNDPWGKGSDLAWLKKKLVFEIKWVKDKKAYSTWEAAAAAYEKQLKIVEKKIQLGSWQAEVDDAINFAATTKSLKVKQWVADLQGMLAADVSNLDLNGIRAKLDELDKEITRLKKARKKVAATAGSLEDLSKAECEKLFKAFDVSDFDATDTELRAIIQESWKNLTAEEKLIVSKYTETYNYLNEPLRGLTYCGCETGYAHDLPILTSALNKMQMPRNICVRRGTNDFMIKELGKDLSQLQPGDQFVDGAFLSTACHPRKGFFKSYNMVIAVPKGAKGIYAEPLTHYNGADYSYLKGIQGIWNGVDKVPFGDEMEWIGQRGAKFEVIKVTGNTIYLKMIAQLQ